MTIPSCSGIVLVSAFITVAPAFGQEPGYASPVVQAVTADGQTVIMSAPAGAAPPAVTEGMPKRPEAKVAAEAKPGAKPGAEAEKKPEEAKPAEPPKAITRPDKPPQPPDPEELKAMPGEDGRVRFNFRGQSWPDVLDWLARITGMSLDWQELPGDYLNLTTQRSYSVDEAKDLINRHLLARGYTLLENGEVLSVVGIAKLNPGMVPRIEPVELLTKSPHAFVKVSFPLDWLMATMAVDELQPMLSPHGKLKALQTTNRLEAMDVVVNLREIYAVLQQEQSDTGQERLVREFVLKYAKASDVQGQLETLLGVEKKTRSPMATDPRQMAEMQQQQARMMAEMQQQQMQAQQGGKPVPPQAAKEQPVNLVVNPRKNSILAHAPPDKMAIIEQAIKAIDVPTDQFDSLLINSARMQVYRLHNIDPTPLVKTLLDVGDLSPTARLEVDSRNNAVIAYATLADHVVIRQLVDRLDGSGRKFDVIPLRRLAADYVAGTIEFMMGSPKKEPETPRYYFDYYSSRSNRQETSEQDKFRVDADVENNRLLLFANEIEIAEVMNLLVKLGEVPPEGGNRSTVRVLEAVSPEATRELFQKLEQAWPSLAPNPLRVPSLAPPADTSTEPPAKTTPKTPGPASPSSATAEPPSPVPHTHVLTRFVATAEADEADLEPLRPADPPRSDPPAPREMVDSQPEPAETGSLLRAAAAARLPVSVTIGPDGRLVISSQDPAALDTLEELIAQLTPPPRDYEVFRLKYADAYWVMKNLESYFKEDEDQSKNQRGRYFYYYDYPPQQKTESKRTLSKRRKLKFIYDLDTNSILVQGADRQQLQTIKELIEVYDKPTPSDAQTARVSAVFPIRYSKADVIAETIKDVYRDLLSANDKALAQNPEQRNRMPNQTTYIFNEGGESEPERTQVSFKGKLSIGVDTVTNTLIVSAEGEPLMRSVSEMIETLDEAAQPLSSVSVIPLKGNVNAEQVRKVLSAMFQEPQPPAPGEAKPGAKPPHTPGEGASHRGGEVHVIGG